MAEPGVFEKIANQVLESAERIATRMEEGVSVLMSGKLPTNEEQQQADIPDQDEDELLIEEEEDFGGSPLDGIADGVLDDIMSGQAGPQTPMDHIHAFRSAIRWTEPFILSLLVFHVLVFSLCIWASRPNRSLMVRVSTMLFMGILVKCSEQLNDYGAQHWQDFSTQNYFDKRGIFIGIFLSGPLLLDSFLMLVFFLKEASQLLVQVKTMELKKKQEEEKKKKSGQKNRVSKKRD